MPRGWRTARPAAAVLAALVAVAALLAALLAPSVAVARALPDLTGRVVRVADGDTITILQGTTRIRIRLVDIDAPEGGQPWGRNARQMLAGLVAGREVRVVPFEQDRYGRTVGRVFLPGGSGTAELDVCREMVRQGGAWAYAARLRDRSKIALQREAQTGRRGLWALPPGERIPPWDWRRQQREERGARRAARPDVPAG